MKKFLVIICLISILFPISVNVVNAYDYSNITLRQVTSEDEIKADASKEYIIVYEDADKNTKYAMMSTALGNDSLNMGKQNAAEVEIEGEQLTIVDDYNIESMLWVFSKSTITVGNEVQKPTLEMAYPLFSGKDETKKQLQFEATNTAKNPAGMTFKQNSYGFNFKFYDDGTTRIQQETVNEKNSYLRFYSPDKRFLSSKLGNSSRVKIYEVLRKYSDKSTFKITGIESEPQYPNPGSVKLDKIATTIENYKNKGVANVILSVDGTRLNRDVDVVLVIDDSNSVHEKIDGTENRRVDIIRKMTAEFAKSILEINPNNRIGVVRFAGDINYLEESKNLGLSNDITKIENLIMIDKNNEDGGTNYTAAFGFANGLLEDNSEENRDSIVIFISDGAPSIYNRLKYTVYKNTDDGIVGNYATNWMKYVLNTDLQENRLMKESGVKIYTIGSENTTRAITSNGAFVVDSRDTMPLLKKLATEKSFFYDWAKLEEELDEIYEEIAKDFYVIPTNAVVNNILGDEVRLLTKTVDGIEPKIKIKNGDKLIEEITIKNDGKEAYSNLGIENVLTIEANGKIKIETQYFEYTEEDKTMIWKIGNVYPNQLKLEYPVYLTESVNMYEDGIERLTGIYKVSKNAQLKYTNHLNESITRQFPVPEINWEKESVESHSEMSQVPDPAPSTQVINESGDVVKTGDNITLYVIGFMVSVVVLIVLLKIKRNLNK